MAVIVAIVLVETGTVVPVNVAVDCPAGTTTVAGIVTAFELEARVMVVPPAGAFPDRVTVPFTIFPQIPTV